MAVLVIPRLFFFFFFNVFVMTAKGVQSEKGDNKHYFKLSFSKSYVSLANKNFVQC